MNRVNISKIILCFMIFSVCLGTSQLVQAASDVPLAVGRDNPFADIPRPLKPVVNPVVDPTEAMAEAPDLFVGTATLKFLDAENLKDAVKMMSSPWGSIAVNAKNNSLIVCDTKERLARIISEVKKADKTPPQIVIEVVILDVQLTDDTEMGINWDILSDKNYDIGYRQNFTTSRLLSTVEDADTIGDASAFNTRGLGGDFSIISGTVRNVVHLIQQKRDAEILANPRVMMVSGETAFIQAVEELPYTEVIDTAAGGASALTATEFKEVGVKLLVSAVLTDSNDIFLSVNAEQNVTTGESNTEVPIVDTRRARSSLLLKDGEVVMFGGLRRQEKTKEVDQIPIIGDLPVIGWLFKSRHTVVRNSELIVFLAPHIYRGEPIPSDAMEKFKEITEKPLLTFPGDKKASKKESSKKVLQEKTEVLRRRKNQGTKEEMLASLRSLDKMLTREVDEWLSTAEEPRGD